MLRRLVLYPSLAKKKGLRGLDPAPSCLPAREVRGETQNYYNHAFLQRYHPIFVFGFGLDIENFGRGDFVDKFFQIMGKFEKIAEKPIFDRFYI